MNGKTAKTICAALGLGLLLTAACLAQERDRPAEPRPRRAERDDALRHRFVESLPPEERERLQARLDMLAGMTPEEVAGLKAAMRHFMEMSPEERQELHEKAERIRQLPP